MPRDEYDFYQGKMPVAPQKPQEPPKAEEKPPEATPEQILDAGTNPETNEPTPTQEAGYAETLTNVNEQQLDKAYNNATQQLDETIQQQQEIVDEGMKKLSRYKYSDPNYIPPWLKPAVDNLQRLRQDRAALDAAYQQGKISIRQYREQIQQYREATTQPDPIEELTGIPAETRSGAIAKGAQRATTPFITRPQEWSASPEAQERYDRAYANLLAAAEKAGQGPQQETVKYRAIPGPAAGPRPGSVGEKIQGGFNYIGELAETQFEKAESWLAGLSSTARATAEKQKLSGLNAKAGISFAMSGAAKTGEGLLAGASFLVRPKRWGESFEGAYILATDERARMQAVERVLTDPYSAATYGGGMLLGGYLAGKAVSKALPEKVTTKTTTKRILSREYKYKVAGESPTYRWLVEKQSIPVVEEKVGGLFSAKGMNEWPESGRVGFGATKGYMRTGGDLIPLEYEPSGALTEVESYRLLRIDPVRAYNPKLRIPTVSTSTTRITSPMFGDLSGYTSIFGVSQAFRVNQDQRQETESLLKQRSNSLFKQKIGIKSSQIVRLSPPRGSQVTLEKQEQRSILSLGLRVEQRQVQSAVQRTTQKQEQTSRKETKSLISPIALQTPRQTYTPVIETKRKKPKKRREASIFGRESRSYRLLDPEDILR